MLLCTAGWTLLLWSLISFERSFRVGIARQVLHEGAFSQQRYGQDDGVYERRGRRYL
jgi:hypothetical protein